MIITRSPLRVTLGGGGTDVPAYSQQHGVFLIAAAMDKYVRQLDPSAIERIAELLPAVRHCRPHRGRTGVRP
jgi:galactokinase/mevalonate kinase-like predicted kinase